MVKAQLAAVMLLAGSMTRAGDLSPSVPHYNPGFPVFGGGKFVNIFDSDAALTNASAHVGWALALPLAGKAIGGRKGLWIAGLSWMTATLAQEALFHAPANPGPGYPAEVRADLLTRLVPTMALLAWDVLHDGGAPAIPAQRLEPPRVPLRVELPADSNPSLRWLCLDEPGPVRPATRIASAAGEDQARAVAPRPTP
ncbi:MAG: hypothetical protein ACJ79E_11610 [Anaeromyxobacteraceae bacterium]